jgi:uncharacterized Ntn-hydrolase superfamily protein
MNALPFLEPLKTEDYITIKGTKKDGSTIDIRVVSKQRMKEDSWAWVHIREDLFDEKIKRMMERFNALDLNAESYKECLEQLEKNIIRPVKEERRREYGKILDQYFNKMKQLKTLPSLSEQQQEDLDEMTEYLSHTEKYKNKL